MGQVFDGVDYKRRLADAQRSLSTGSELKSIVTGRMAEFEVKQAFQDAKLHDLEKARAQMLRAIDQARENQQFGQLVPTEVEEIVTGSSDELVRVDGSVQKFAE